MNTNNSYCLSSPMDEHKTENLWSECFQDLGSWCHQPQDELNTPNVNNQNEFNFSFDDQSMYYHQLDSISSSIDLKGDMWKSQTDTDLSNLQFNPEEDNNNSPMLTMMDEGKCDTSIRYSGNVVLTQCIFNYNDSTDKDVKPSVSKTLDWINTSQKIVDHSKHHNQNNVLIEKKNDLEKINRQKLDPIANKPKPSLKLNIAAANKPSSSTDVSANYASMNTPDVLKSLTEDADFSLISFVCENFEEDGNLMAVDPSSIISEKPRESYMPEQIIKIDHDYAETLPSSSSSDESKYHTLESVVKGKESFEVSQVKEEIDNRYLPVTVKEEPSSPAKQNESLGKRVRKSVAEQSEDFIFDDDPPSDHSSDWLPFVKKRAKTSRNKNERANKRSRTSSVSDCSSVCDGSVTSGPDRYRELRDKNNEASRRSRMNRKQREVEMTEQANSLLQENIYLKQRAVSLEKRVKSLRGILLRVVLEKNK